MKTETPKQMPKSYMSEDEAEKYLQEGGVGLLCIAQSRLADRAGDEENALAWLKSTKLSASSLDMMKKISGLDYIKENGFDIQNAINEYGEEWAIQ